MRISNDAQAAIFRLNKSSNKYEFLVLYRFDKEKNEDHYRLLKGGIKLGETPKRAIVREVEEEVGIKDALIVTDLYQYSYIVGEVLHNVRVFLINAKDVGDNLKIDSAEEGVFTIKSAKWLNQEKAIEQLNFLEEKKVIELASHYLEEKA